MHKQLIADCAAIQPLAYNREQKLQQSDHILERHTRVRIHFTGLKQGEKAADLIQRASSRVLREVVQSP